MADGFDAWETEFSGKNEYSPWNFYTQSKDGQGHSHQIRVKIPDHWIPILEEMKEAYPEYYKTYHDICRDSIRHRYEWCIANREELKESTKNSMFRAIENADAKLAETESLKTLPGKVRRVCEAYRDVGDKASLIAFCQEQRIAAMNYPEPWRSKVIEVLENFGHRD